MVAIHAGRGAPDDGESMSYCDDCGTKLSGCACPNCDEEFVILTEQSEDIDFAPSDDFMRAVEEAGERIKERRSRERSGQ
jgi:hypothetical protein